MKACPIKKKHSNLFFLLFLPFTVFSQSPGGVSSNLKLWNKANAGVTVSGSNVTAWTDQTATNTFTVTGTPTLQSSALNYNPTVSFNGSSYFSGNKPINNVTQAFAVGKIVNGSGVAGSGALIGMNTAFGLRGYRYFFHTEGGKLYATGNVASVFTSYSSANSIFYSLLSEDLSKTPSASDMIRLNGTAQTNNSAGDPVVIAVDTPTLGSRSTEALLNGSELAEAVLYTSSLSSTNVNQVESYLAIKYGITLGTNYVSSAASTVYDMSTYNSNVIGIARDDNSALMQKQSHRSDDSTRIYLSTLAADNVSNSGSFSSDGQFVMMGSNGAAVAVNPSNTEYPPGYGILTRIDREWKITNTAFTGTFSLDIKMASGTFDPTKIKVLIDDDGNFTNATMFSPTISYSSGTITISGISNSMIPASTTKYLTIAAVVAAPGGIGTESIWIKPDAGITQSSGAISEWDDISGYGINLIQNSAGQQPVLGTDTLNYYPVPAFDAVDDVLEDSTVAVNALMNVSTGSNTSTTGSLFTVSKIKSFASGGRTMYQWNRNPSATNFYTLSTVDAGTGNIRTGSRSINVGNNTLPSTIPPFIATALETPGANNTAHYYNGGREIKTTNATININTSTTNFLRVGNAMNGYVAEIVSYKTKLTDLQRRQIESYLALKYAITLDTTTNGNGSTVYGDYFSSSGTTLWDASVSSYAYHNNVIGIGRDDSSYLYQRQSHQLDDSTRIYLSSLATTNAGNSGTFSSDQQFVILGNNQGSLRAYSNSNEFPSGQGIYSRIDREWKITNTNFSGTFSMDVRLNTTPILASNLEVLIDDDGNFTNATLYNPGTTYSGGVVTIPNISTSMIPANSTKYLTIVSMNSSTPLVLQLLSFTATARNDREVALNWQMANTDSNGYFVIERSADAAHWRRLDSVKDISINPTFPSSYPYVDQLPITGLSYYRLEHVDINGDITLSPVRAVNINASIGEGVKIYPNPTSNQITVEGSKDEISIIHVYDAVGRDVTASVKMVGTNGTQAVLNLSRLIAGIYNIKTKTVSHTVWKQ